MRTVTLIVSSQEEMNQRFLNAFKGEPQGTFISFESAELLFKVLTGERWRLLKIMTGKGPMGVREAARRLGREEKEVHGDIKALLKTGILEKADNDLFEFPFDALHVEFTLKAA